uniref:Uncharacterized protein n=1 Tax=Chlorocebus sabaeus TaxID=60711 RepID=A0A0D9SCD5_CHLSB
RSSILHLPVLTIDYSLKQTTATVTTTAAIKIPLNSLNLELLNMLSPCHWPT